MRLTVGPLPAAVYWRRRAVLATALALVIILFAVMCSGPDASTPLGGAGHSPTSPRTDTSATTDSPAPDGSGVPTGASSPAGAGATGAATGDGSGDSNGGSGSGSGGSGAGGDDGADGGQVAPPVVASVACSDAEIALTAEVSPSPGIYGGVITLTLVVRNIADHACLRDVGSAPQELQVRQGGTVIWSSDHCDTPQASDVRAFGPNIESRFSRRWNTYRLAPQECDPPAGTAPAPVGAYEVVARLGTKLSVAVPFEIQN